jgi:hypothetical protein
MLASLEIRSWKTEIRKPQLENRKQKLEKTFVVPAKAGIQALGSGSSEDCRVDSRFRGNDGYVQLRKSNRAGPPWRPWRGSRIPRGQVVAGVVAKPATTRAGPP